MSSNDQIWTLIPQRPPFVMVDRLTDVGEYWASTSLEVKEDNLFLDHGVLRETGIIEHLAQSAAAMEGWKVQNGQWRTDCPKGIRSRLQHACSLCMGCCVNIHPGHPTYDWRLPQKATKVNGKEITTDGVKLNDGDVIEVGKQFIKVTVDS